jgi:hypothetical protein
VVRLENTTQVHPKVVGRTIARRENERSRDERFENGAEQDLDRPPIRCCPLSQCKSGEQSKMAEEQSIGERLGEEDVLRNESPVDCPLEKKLAGEVECTSKVGTWVREEEGVGDNQVHEEHIEEVEERLEKTELFDEDEDDAWEIEKDVHLDGDGEAAGRG